MAKLAEVALAQAEQRGAVELGVAADVVVRVRVERLAVLVVPHFLGVVLAPSTLTARESQLSFSRGT